MRGSVQDFSLANPIYAGATVTFYTVSGGAKTTTKATLYNSINGATTLANPQYLDSDGKFVQPVYIAEPVVITVSGLTVADHDTGIVYNSLSTDIAANGDPLEILRINAAGTDIESKTITELGLEEFSHKDASGGYAGLTLLKINFKNALNTVTSFFTNANTVARTYTFQDRDGTIADNTELALKTNVADLAATTGSTLVGFIQAGVGAILRTVSNKLRDHISVKDYDVAGDGVTDDTAEIQAAITANYGKRLYFPSGTYKVSALTVSGELEMYGDGNTRTIISLISGSNTVPLTVNDAPNFVMKDMAVDGNKTGNPTGTWAVRLTGTNTKPKFIRSRFYDAKTTGISVGGTCDYLVVKDCIATGCDVDGMVASTATKTLFEGNTATSNGRFGILITASLARVINNICDANSATTTGGAGIGLINGADYSIVSGNQCFNNGVAGSVYSHGIQLNATNFSTVTGNYCAGNIGNGIDLTLASTYNTVVGNISANNYDVGIAVDSLSHYCTVSSNIVRANLNPGIYSYASYGTKIVGNQVIDNGLDPTAVAFAGVGSAPYGILFDGYTNGGVDYYGTNGIVIGNEIRGSSHASGTGLKIVAGAITPQLGVIVNDNTLAGNTAPQMVYTQSNVQSVHNNTGWVTAARGAATIPNGATSVVVTHGLDVTPASTNVHVTANNSGTNDPGDIWLDTFTSTQFTIHCRNDPGASGITFGWQAGRI